jgi:hypothetical protein
MRKMRDFVKHVGRIISPKLGSSSAGTQAEAQPQQTREGLALGSIHRPNLLHSPIQLCSRRDQEGGPKETWQHA